MADIDPGSEDRDKESKPWENQVSEKERRKLRARNKKNQSVWFGFGMFGVIGWSVVVPTLIGIFVGVWIDRTWPSQFSWTLMLMLGGLVMGCLNAWNWIQTESAINKSTKKEKRDDDK